MLLLKNKYVESFTSTNVIKITFCLFFAVFVGIVSGFGSPFLLLTGGITCIAFFLAPLSYFLKWTATQSVLFIILSLFFGLEIIHKVFGVPLYGYWQAFVLAIGILGIPSLWIIISKSSILKISTLSFFGFFIIAAISTANSGRANISAVGYQILSDLKLPLALGFGIYIFSKLNTSRAIDRTISIIIPISVAALILQWVFPSAYLAIFRESKIPVEAMGIMPSPGLSIFNHPSILAATSAALALYVIAKCINQEEHKKRPWVSGAALIILLLASNQRQEIFAFSIAATLIFAFSDNTKIITRISTSLFFLFIVLILFIIVFEDTFIRESTSWGLSSYQSITHPRAELYDGAIAIAEKYFPLGSGLGTFGGVGSSKYDLSLPYEMGLGNSWWWKEKEAYLLDTYWPNSLAETGFIGALLLLAHYLLLAFYSFQQAWNSESNQEKMLWLCAGSSFLWILLNTPTSPGFQEMRLLFFPSIFFGIAVNFKKKSDIK